MMRFYVMERRVDGDPNYVGLFSEVPGDIETRSNEEYRVLFTLQADKYSAAQHKLHDLIQQNEFLRWLRPWFGPTLFDE
jgi:hypothetical protein